MSSSIILFVQQQQQILDHLLRDMCSSIILMDPNGLAMPLLVIVSYS